jgi:copper transport protein
MNGSSVPFGTAQARHRVWGGPARRWLLAGPMAAAIVLGWSGVASAHAAVVSSSPASGAHVLQAPTSVTVVFDQPVKPDNGGLIVLASNGSQVNSGAATHPSPDTLQVALPGNLGNGAFVANYTVTSVDGHVVSGGIVFLVGHANAGDINQLARRTSPVTGFVDKFGQFLIYLGVLVGAGLAFFLAFILPTGPERGRLRRWCMAAIAVGAAGVVVTVAAQAALTGGSWGALAHWSVVRQAGGGKFGAQTALQIVGLAACVWSLRLSNAVAAQFAAFYGLLASAGAFVLFGHAIASPERWLSIPADVVHAVVAAMWIGGLAGLVVVLHSRTRAARRAGELAPSLRAQDHGVSIGDDPRPGPVVSYGSAATAVLERSAPPQRADGNGIGNGTGNGIGNGSALNGRELTVLESTVEVVGRFSTMAGVSVAVLIVAGVLLAVAEVGSLSNLVDTGYGQILLVKVALVGLLLFMAAYNRYLLLPVLFAAAKSRRGNGATGDTGALGAGWRRLRATVRVEAVGVVAVLAVTSVLANGTPSNGAPAVARPVPFAQTQPFEGGHLSLRITPNQALVNNFVVQFTGAGGAPADKAESVSVYLTFPAENVGPIEADLHRVGVGKFVLSDTPDPPIIGTWQITLQIQVSPFDEPDASFVDQVR